MYLEKYDLKGRVAVVTGGGQAIGLACVEALAEAGARVVIADYNEKIAEDGRDAMKAKGYACDVAVVDVTDAKGIEALADKLGRVDILVNNAGIARSEIPAEKMEDERWLNVLDVNLNGTFWCCRSFGKRMLGAGKG
jgi:NAD(P)-dependent dehydrogenase (short-subunit alcohol dehydrogenase family)